LLWTMIDHRFWARYFQVYDVLNSVPTYTQLLDSLCEELDLKDGALVLDVGSGTGNLALKLKASGFRVVAIDFCRQALESHVAKDSEGCVLLTDLRRELPFRDSCFDGIACNNVLYTLSVADQIRVAKEFHRVLKPDGRVAVANPRIGWQAMTVYLNTVEQNLRVEGAWLTARKAVRQIVPTIKMLCYNWRLARDNQYHYFELHEQLELLKSVGFSHVSDTTLVYAGQVVLNSALK
jgi:ubiquinone/menaquinone biosynthesis C-methylase UbiE